MSKKRSTLILPTLIAFVSIAPIANASGSSTQRPPRVPTEEEAKTAEERKKFALGQRIFNEKINVMDVAVDLASEAAQHRRLEVLEASLPPAIAKKKNLVAMAGRLTEEQLAGLEMFIQQRYPAKK